jgi:hypothetical protein
LVWWLGTHRIDRFWLPAIPLACGLAAVGRRGSLAACRRVGQLHGAVEFDLRRLFGRVWSDCRQSFFRKSVGVAWRLGDGDLPGRLTSVIGWANQTLVDPATRLLLIGEAKAYDFRMPIVYSTCFDRSPAEAWLVGQSPETQRDNLAQAGITHVLINWNELARYRSPGNYGFSAWPQREDIERLVADQVLRPMVTPFDAGEAEVFEVFAPAERSSEGL